MIAIALFSQLLLAGTLHSWSALAKDIELSGTIQTAWKAFLLKLFSLIEEQLPQEDEPIHTDIATLKNRLKSCREKPAAEVPEMWIDRYKTYTEVANGE